MRMTNKEVIQAWTQRDEATSHTGNLSTYKGYLYSYNMLIGFSAMQLVNGRVIKGLYIVRHMAPNMVSMTTSHHVSKAIQAVREYASTMHDKAFVIEPEEAPTIRKVLTQNIRVAKFNKTSQKWGV